MINVLICGINGKMGKNILSLIQEDGETYAVCGVDVTAATEKLPPVYAAFGDVKEKPDVIIDFSSPAVLPRGACRDGILQRRFITYKQRG